MIAHPVLAVTADCDISLRYARARALYYALGVGRPVLGADVETLADLFEAPAVVAEWTRTEALLAVAYIANLGFLELEVTADGAIALAIGERAEATR